MNLKQTTFVASLLCAAAITSVKEADAQLAWAGVEKTIPLRIVHLTADPSNAYNLPYGRLQEIVAHANRTFVKAGVQFRIKSVESHVSPLLSDVRDVNWFCSSTATTVCTTPTCAVSACDRLATWNAMAPEIQAIYPGYQPDAAYANAVMGKFAWLGKAATEAANDEEYSVWIMDQRGGDLETYPNSARGTSFDRNNANNYIMSHALGHSLGLAHIHNPVVFDPRTNGCASGETSTSNCKWSDFSMHWDLLNLTVDECTGATTFSMPSSEQHARSQLPLMFGGALPPHMVLTDNGLGQAYLYTSSSPASDLPRCLQGGSWGNHTVFFDNSNSPEGRLLLRGTFFRFNQPLSTPTPPANPPAGYPLYNGVGSNVMGYITSDRNGDFGISDAQAKLLRRYLRNNTEINPWAAAKLQDGITSNLSSKFTGARPLGSNYNYRSPVDKLDFNGDGQRDVAFWTPPRLATELGTVTIRLSAAGVAFNNWQQITVPSCGHIGDIPVFGDFHGNGRTDIAFYRPGGGVSRDNGNDTQGYWEIGNQTSCTLTAVQWGERGDVPFPGLDFDGNPATPELVVWRPETGGWYVRTSTNSGASFTQFSSVTSIPHVDSAEALPGFYDGDDKTDIAIYSPRDASFNIALSTISYTAHKQYMPPHLAPLRGKPDGSAMTPQERSSAHPVRGVGSVVSGKFRSDLAVFASEGDWYMFRGPGELTSSAQVAHRVDWGSESDMPLGSLGNVADTTRQSDSRLAVFRGSQGKVHQCTSGTSNPSYPENCQTASSYDSVVPDPSYPNSTEGLIPFTTGDLDGDGKPELWFHEAYAGKFTVRFSTASYSPSAERTITVLHGDIFM